MTHGVGPAKAIQEYWQHAATDQGKIKGPIHLVLKVLRQCGVKPTGPTSWHLPQLGQADIARVADFPNSVTGLGCFGDLEGACNHQAGARRARVWPRLPCHHGLANQDFPPHAAR